MKLKQLAIIVVIFLAACAVPHALDLPDDPKLPAEWGSYDSKIIANSACPDIGGQYLETPERYTVKKNGAQFSSGNDYSFYSVFPFHIAASDVKEIPFRDSSQRYLYLEQQNPNLIELTHVQASGNFIEVSSFSASEGDFICRDGFIEFPLDRNYGQIEGTTLNGQVRKRLGKAKDGSLIVIYAFGPYKSRTAIDPADFVHEFYRFRPKD